MKPPSSSLSLTTFQSGTKIPGTNYQLDPIRGAFNIGTMIRWLDYNDCWLAAECTSGLLFILPSVPYEDYN